MTNALVLVAHPDDETIWMGGTILRNKKWNWTIMSLCRSRDRDRAPKFKRVCEKLKARCFISDLDDEKLKPLSNKQYSERILKKIKRKNFDYIFTHGSNGEYGHIRHKEVHKAVKDLVKKKKLQTDNLLFFNYKNGNRLVPGQESLKVTIPKKNYNLRTKLNSKELQEKKRIVNKMYGYSKNSFEVLSCNREERFLKAK